MDIDQAITSRRSIRRFLSKPVSAATVAQILEIAARAPSGTNMQPWKVYVLTGTAKERLSSKLVATYQAQAASTEHDQHKSEYDYYPTEFVEPYKSRRRAVGLALYRLLGIKKGETDQMIAQHARNFLFFDAPVGLIFTIDRDLQIGSWLDYGMFLQNIMIGARARGLHSCPQAAFATFHKIIRAELAIPENEIVVCGMSLGYADKTAAENQLITDRIALDEFVTFIRD